MIAQQLSSNMTTEKIDTAITKSYPVTAKPGIFETAYFEGTEVKVNDTVRLIFYPVDIGKINLETGKVVACDPAMTYQQEPFITQFPTGRFPVQLAIAKVNGNENELVGFSRILFSEEPVVKWEFALKKGQEPISIFGKTMYYYPVDGGLGQFMDESSFNKLEKLDEHSNSQVLDTLFAELDKHTGRSWQFANTSYKNINMVAFTSGFGDGRYSTYVGYDKDGKPCRLLTDFGLVEWLEQ
ncbi:MAG: DUF4241 domain-containing protein [Bacillota bacterium]|nr:DUF4241 domain-containing protein [Bacillota bacterium]